RQFRMHLYSRAPIVVKVGCTRTSGVLPVRSRVLQRSVPTRTLFTRAFGCREFIKVPTAGRHGTRQAHSQMLPLRALLFIRPIRRSSGLGVNVSFKTILSSTVRPMAARTGQ